ncbi:MAG: hypothetical protein KGJ58_00660 [Patescibacteria group bacterium]|nr:hypothetical protein [Patescibacteria group bacterium]MDE1988588.1 hypothetical protein [Patescibacteria group bacterium]MDE2217954.1 hypothetical protein [Patescibacteria group bacterium]
MNKKIKRFFTLRQMSAVFKQAFNSPLYWIIMIEAALAVGVLYWQLLSKVTTVINFYLIYRNAPLYLYSYAGLAFLSMILFGLNAAILVYLWRESKSASAKYSGGSVLGAFFGSLGSACPSCGAFLLSFLGVSGGVAMLPFRGLEILFASVVILGVSLLLSLRRLAAADSCELCPIQPDKSGNAATTNARKRSDHNQKLYYQASLVVLFLIIFFVWPLFQNEIISASSDAKSGLLLQNKINFEQKNEAGSKLYVETLEKVLPKGGFETGLALSGIVPKMVSYGIIDADKFRKLYGRRGLDEGSLSILTRNSKEPLKINENNAGLLLNIFWPLGISNKTNFNEKSRLKGDSLFNFASTGGWTLGKEDNGGKYFNRYEIIKLTEEQEEVVLKVAGNTYRPCCGNSTFFQDCNHGSALLGAIELGASQGMSEEELYKLALKLNSFWFPDTYLETALYFKIAKSVDWEDVGPKEIMSFEYSSGPGWAKNVAKTFQEILKDNPDLLPKTTQGGGCGV